ncbi:MAG TPA: FAD-dependent oxidoreductase, partial [Acidobacteriota bacterium]|nr:FAD-dependent oxidoreductase [Acidobacteriota bacterium]
NTIRYFEAYLKEYHVVLELNTIADVSLLKGFDSVIVATGARPRLPDIPGSQLAVCMDYDRYFREPERAGARVVVIGAGGIGCDVAHLLSNGQHSYPPPSFFDDPNRVSGYEDYLRSLPRRRSVSLTRRGKRIAEKLGPTTRWAIIQLLEHRGVQMLTQIQYGEITESGLKLSSRTGKEIFLEADTIVLATGQTPENSLYERLRNQVAECYLVGAAHTASETNAQSAIWEASEAARKI